MLAIDAYPKNRPTTKKQSKKSAKKPATKKTSDLRKPQLRILAAVAKAKEPLSRTEIATKAKVDLAWLTEYVGSSDAKTRAKNDKKLKSLLTLGFVMAVDSDDAATKYRITPAGRKIVAK